MNDGEWPNQRQIAVARALGDFLELCRSDTVNHVERDLIQRQIAQVAMKPNQLLFVFLVRGLVRGLFQPANYRFTPRPFGFDICDR